MKVVAFFKLHFLSFFFLCFSFLYCYQFYKIGDNYQRFDKVINEDALGYYIILPTFFQYHDPNFEFIDTVLRKTERYQHYVPPVINVLQNGEKVCKYYSGVALLQSPFYLINSYFFENKSKENGFKNSNHLAVMLSAMFYLLLGFWCMMDVLKRLKINPILIALSISMALFGGNLLAYSSYDIAYSHVYSFFALVFFIRSIFVFKLNLSFKAAIASGLFFGLIVIIRPLNGISILMFPIIFGWRSFFNLFGKTQFTKILVACISVLFVLGIQSLVWHWQTNMWYIYPYVDESLNLKNPQMFQLIFGYNCGWAMYSPLPFISLIIALFLLIVKGRFRQFIWALIFSFLLLYLLSSWYYLHYGCTVGCRPITEFYGPLYVLFAYAVNPFFKKLWLKTILIFYAILGIYYNQIVHKQFFENIINWCEMDEKRYKMVFLKTHEAYKYATSPFWDFSKFNQYPAFTSISIQENLSIGASKNIDQFQLSLPPLEANDSALLFYLHIKGGMKNEINDSYLRILINNGDEYVELLNLLLLRKINNIDKENDFIYQFHVSKTMDKPLLNISLESVNNKAETSLFLEKIEIKRIKL